MIASVDINGYKSAFIVGPERRPDMTIECRFTEMREFLRRPMRIGDRHD